jgi:hypothetical protein
VSNLKYPPPLSYLTEILHLFLVVGGGCGGGGCGGGGCGGGGCGGG